MENRRELFFSTEEMPLTVRLDHAYALYQLLEEEKSDDSHLKEQVVNFLKTVLDEEKLKNVHFKMKQRELKKNRDSEYIPGKQALPLFPMPSPFWAARESKDANAKIEFKWQYIANLILAAQRERILFVDEDFREEDEDDEVPMLNAKERDYFRVLIKDGKFVKRQVDNSFVNYDTRDQTTGRRENFGCYNINYKGEISVFSFRSGESKECLEIELGLQHSSFSAGGPAFAAGELQIKDGSLTILGARSGHFKPKMEHLYQVLCYLKKQKVDLTKTKIYVFESHQMKSLPFKKIPQGEVIDYEGVYEAHVLLEHLEKIDQDRYLLLKKIKSSAEALPESSRCALSDLRQEILKTDIKDYETSHFEEKLAEMLVGIESQSTSGKKISLS